MLPRRAPSLAVLAVLALLCCPGFAHAHLATHRDLAVVEPVLGFLNTYTNSNGTRGVAWGDVYDYPFSDVGFTSTSGDHFWISHGSGGFLGGPLLGSQDNPQSIAWGDYDNDGHLDAACAANIPVDPIMIFHNEANANADFFEVAQSLGVTASQCFGVAWADFDRDGDLDLCIARQGGSGSTLFENQGGSSFVEAGGFEAGIGVAWGDYDNDRWPDLYIANRAVGTSHLYHNVSGTFVDVTTPTLANNGGKGYTCAWVDYDNDGKLDLYVGNSTAGGGSNSQLFRNTDLTAAGFTNVTMESGIVANRGTGAWGDYDNDGVIDLYARHDTGYRLWRGAGDGTFSDVTQAPLGASANGGVGWGDYDGDGQIDLAVADSTGPTNIFHNDGNLNSWLEVDLVGTTSNRFGIGARIEVVAGGVRQLREISASSGYLCMNSITANFGLGVNATIDSAIVTWPTGMRQVVRLPGIKRRIVVIEGQTTGVGSRADVPILLANQPNPFSGSTVLRYDLARPMRVELDVIDPSGRRIRTLLARHESAGRHELAWDGRSDTGTRVPAGIYLVRLRSDAFNVTRRIVFVP